MDKSYFLRRTYRLDEEAVNPCIAGLLTEIEKRLKRSPARPAPGFDPGAPGTPRHPKILPDFSFPGVLCERHIWFRLRWLRKYGLWKLASGIAVSYAG